MHITSGTRGPFDDLLAVANTRHGPGGHYHARPTPAETEHDHLVDPGDARRFLADHHVLVPADDPADAQLAELREIRELVRTLAGDPAEVVPAGPAVHGPAAPGPAIHEPAAPGPAAQAIPDEAVERLVSGRLYRLDRRGRPRTVARGWQAVVDALIPALLELADVGERLRVCSNPACRFAFVDRSRNRSRLWCESAFCGNRIRVGRHRHRATVRPARAR